MTQEKDYSTRSILLFLITLMLLFFLQLIPEKTKIGTLETKEFDLFMDVKPD